MAPLFLMLSCVKDVDINQFEEIVVPPTAALDLIYFNLAPSDFSDGAGGIKNVSDDVRLEFLDDDYIQDGLMQADFNFRFTNTFAQEFKVVMKFLSESNSEQHTINFHVPAGSTANPAILDYTERIDESQIGRIRRSIKLLVEVEMQPNSQPIEGTLQLESKAYYTFEF